MIVLLVVYFEIKNPVEIEISAKSCEFADHVVRFFHSTYFKELTKLRNQRLQMLFAPGS